MAATKSKKTGPVSETEYTEHATADAGASYEQAEWVEPAEGTVCEGTLMRAFVMRDDLAGPGRKSYRSAYVYADEQGHEFTFGEKAGFSRAIRSQNLGVGFRLTFIGKERQKDAKGNPTAKTIWVTKFETKGQGVGPSVLSELIKSHKQLVESGADLPF